MSIALLTASSLLLSACGGGGGDGGGDGGGNNPPPTTTAEGLWVGTTSNGRTVAGVVLDNSQFWVIYTSVGNGAVIAGAVQGDGSYQGNSFTSSNGKDFNFEGAGVNGVDVNATFAQEQSLSGSITYDGSPTEFTFTSTYNPDYDLQPSLSTVAGTYAGSGYAGGGVEFTTVTIAAAGSITGVSSSGCAFTGSVTPHSKGNVYDVSITFGGGVCANGSNTVAGVGYYDAAMNRITSAGLNGTRTSGFIFVGDKP